MSEEELLKYIKTNKNKLLDINSDISDDLDIELLINLIEKQQKEIEELKKPKFIMNAETGEVTKIHNDFISKDKIRYYYYKICASVNHFESKNDNNIVLRIKKYLEKLLEE